jgi:hypothetical protein
MIDYKDESHGDLQVWAWVWILMGLVVATASITYYWARFAALR